jgi:hypothetical protein
MKRAFRVSALLAFFSVGAIADLPAASNSFPEPFPWVRQEAGCCRCPSFGVFIGRVKHWHPEVRTIEIEKDWRTMYFTFAFNPVIYEDGREIPFQSLADKDLLAVVYFSNTQVVCMERLSDLPKSDLDWLMPQGGLESTYQGVCQQVAWNACGGPAGVESPSGSCVAVR